MLNRNLILCFSLITLWCAQSYGQQDPQYTQYIYNPLVINPAYAGNREALDILVLHRSQWVGLDGAPTTQNFTIHGPLGNSNAGLGLSVINDALGPARETYLNVDFSYRIKTSSNGKLNFGLKGVLNLLDVDLNRADVFDQQDPLLENIDNRLSPNVGVGVFYNTDDFYLGVSAPNLLQTKHFDRSGTVGSESFIAKERIHFYGLAGYVFDLNTDLKLKPATMIKMVQGAPLQVDLTGNLLIKEKLTLGVAYRWSAAISALVGFQLSDRFSVGFAYDRETTELGNAVYNDGTYEIFLRYEIFKNNKRVINPRFF